MLKIINFYFCFFNCIFVKCRLEIITLFLQAQIFIIHFTNWKFIKFTVVTLSIKEHFLIKIKSQSKSGKMKQIDHNGL